MNIFIKKIVDLFYKNIASILFLLFISFLSQSINIYTKILKIKNTPTVIDFFKKSNAKIEIEKNEETEEKIIFLNYYSLSPKENYDTISKKMNLKKEFLIENNKNMENKGIIKIYSGNFMEYYVKPKDTLLLLTNNYSLEPNSIFKMNKLDTEVLTLGQFILLKNPSKKIYSSSHTTQKDEKKIIYYVKKEDTIISISNKFNIPVKKIIELNSLDKKRLTLGQKIIISK